MAEDIHRTILQDMARDAGTDVDEFSALKYLHGYRVVLTSASSGFHIVCH
jgi:hypothetical protein